MHKSPSPAHRDSGISPSTDCTSMAGTRTRPNTRDWSAPLRTQTKAPRGPRPSRRFEARGSKAPRSPPGSLRRARDNWPWGSCRRAATRADCKPRPTGCSLHIARPLDRMKSLERRRNRTSHPADSNPRNSTDHNLRQHIPRERSSSTASRPRSCDIVRPLFRTRFAGFRRRTRRQHNTLHMRSGHRPPRACTRSFRPLPDRRIRLTLGTSCTWSRRFRTPPAHCLERTGQTHRSSPSMSPDRTCS